MKHKVSNVAVFVKCAVIILGNKIYSLKEGHSYNEYIDFLKSIDFHYNPYSSSFTEGSFITGCIWIGDNKSWIEREEVNNVSQWGIRSMPNIPSICKNQNT